MKTRVAPLLVLTCLLVAPALRAAGVVKLTEKEDRVRVEIDGQLFTEYITKGGPFPYCYPVLAADGTQLNRDFPMKKTEGEEDDHPHHRSLWFTHGSVNGVDFWSESPRRGRIVNDSVTASTKDGVGIIHSKNRWVQPDGTVACTDDTTLRFRAIPDGRLIDFEVTIHATEDKPTVFGDTKEGAMAIRVAQWMTAPHDFKKAKVETKGVIINDSGQTQTAAWGKKSKWVDYHAEKDGKTYGVAMFDNPQNPRHPTWWHVRDYGLFAANPFGQHDFEAVRGQPPLPKNLGELAVPAKGSITFRWRFYFHSGDEKTGKVAEHYAEYAAGK